MRDDPISPKNDFLPPVSGGKRSFKFNERQEILYGTEGELLQR